MQRLMPPTIRHLLCLLLSMFAYAAHAAGPKETLAQFHTALMSGDKTTALALLAPDVMIYESGYVERSRTEYNAHHLAEDMAFAKTSKRKTIQETLRMDGNLALIWEESETTMMSKGKEVLIHGTATSVLEKTGDVWLITHLHWSSRKAK